MAYMVSKEILRTTCVPIGPGKPQDAARWPKRKDHLCVGAGCLVFFLYGGLIMVDHSP